MSLKVAAIFISSQHRPSYTTIIEIRFEKFLLPLYPCNIFMTSPKSTKNHHVSIKCLHQEARVFFLDPTVLPFSIV
jgi:hypothetical protein